MDLWFAPNKSIIYDKNNWEMYYFNRWVAPQIIWFYP